MNGRDDEAIALWIGEDIIPGWIRYAPRHTLRLKDVSLAVEWSPTPRRSKGYLQSSAASSSLRVFRNAVPFATGWHHT